MEKFEDLIVTVGVIVLQVWPKNERYVPRTELHGRILNTLGLPDSKQKNWKFCRKIKAAIRATVSCSEVIIDGHHFYKRI